MAREEIYLNNPYMGEHPDAYKTDKFHPVYLGDVLDDRYHVFRKIGCGSRSNVWLARDKSGLGPRYVALKVFSSKSTDTEKALVNTLQPLAHLEKKHVELPLRSFMIHGPNGDHVCLVLAPLGNSLYEMVEEAWLTRIDLNEDKEFSQGASEGDPWSAAFAKRACWQLLSGLDDLHKHRIAHKDIHTYNIRLALCYDLSTLRENQIQKEVWPKEELEGVQDDQTTNQDTNESPEAPDELSDSDDEPTEWEKAKDECKRLVAAQWLSYEPGDETTEPHSDEWNKANFFNTRESIELWQRKDGKPLGVDEIRYSVAPSHLSARYDIKKLINLEQPFRFVWAGMRFACAFDRCGERPLTNVSDFNPPEALLGLPPSPQGDIFSLGLLFWEVVMLRRLVEHRFSFSDPEKVYLKNRQLRDLAHRLGPVPAALRAQWPAADDFVDAEGHALDMQEQDEEVYGPDDFEYGDIWHHARKRRPLDMSDEDMDAFVRLIQRMLQWQPEQRPSTSELLQDEWFQDLQA